MLYPFEGIVLGTNVTITRCSLLTYTWLLLQKEKGRST